MSGLVGSGARRACTAGRGDAVVSAVDGRQRGRLFVVQIPLITPFPFTPSEAIRAETKAGSPMKNWFKTLVATCAVRSEEHTSELQSLMRISYAVFGLKKKKTTLYVNFTHLVLIHHPDTD